VICLLANSPQTPLLVREGLLKFLFSNVSLNSRKIKKVALFRCRELRQNQTSAEEIFWNVVRNKKFKGLKFYRQYPLFFDYLGKETFYIADFYCHSRKLVIEIDGEIHSYKKDQDKLSTEIINLLGIRVLRFKNDEIILNVKRVLKKIETVLNSN